MMATPDPLSGRQQLERIAEEYRSKGYDVLVEPSGRDLPRFLGDHQPDLIARRGDERLVIEVKSSASEAERDRVRFFAERIESEPGWKLVLIATSPTEELLPGERLSLLSQPEIGQQLEQARSLLASGHGETALLLAWAAIEGQLRTMAMEEGIQLPRPDTPTLLRQLVSLGLVDREQHRLLTDANRSRGAVAHGFRPDRESAEITAMVEALLKLSRDLRTPQESH